MLLQRRALPRTGESADESLERGLAVLGIPQ
jgi:hypothetical protein